MPHGIVVLSLVFLSDFQMLICSKLHVCNAAILLVAGWFNSWLTAVLWTLFKIPMGKMNGKNSSESKNWRMLINATKHVSWAHFYHYLLQNELLVVEIMRNVNWVKRVWTSGRVFLPFLVYSDMWSESNLLAMTSNIHQLANNWRDLIRF